MEDERLTHEWLNAYDALLAGDAKPTLKLVALEKPAPELVRSHLVRLFDGDDEDPDRSKVKVQIKKFGCRRGGVEFSILQSVELALVRSLLIERSGMPVRHIEDFMRRELGNNLRYLREAVRLGNNLLTNFAENDHKFDTPSEEELQKTGQTCLVTLVDNAMRSSLL